MTIIRDTKYKKQLLTILRYIANDKVSASINFRKELDEKIANLIESPFIYRPSYYFDNSNYRDLIYQGYTIIYKIETERILILEIFKWMDR